jgi:beta-glucosidase
MRTIPTKRSPLPTVGYYLVITFYLLVQLDHHQLPAAEQNLQDPRRLGSSNSSPIGWPTDFMWGAATASYQVEGAWKTDGRGMTIWDTFSHTPNKTAGGATGDVADDHYNRFMEDIDRLASLGMKAYRFSIAWSRIMPTGRHPVNPLGIKHYNQVIDYLTKKGITPFVTLFHWDLPEGLEAEGGWLNPQSALWFAAYADVCFANFGNRVKHWVTINEPHSVSLLGYGSGVNAPGRCSDRTRCKQGDTWTEPYVVTHNLLRGHAFAVDIYRRKYQPAQHGVIGIVLDVMYSEPLTNSTEDVEAAERDMVFQCGWFADPIWTGDYPQVMKQRVGARLPKFSEEEKRLLRGSHDYFGLNHYTSWYVANAKTPTGLGYWYDEGVTTTHQRNGVPIGPQAASDWLYVVPWGVRKVLNWVSERYGRTPIYITENGVDEPNETAIPLPRVLNDTFRVDYYKSYLEEIRAAVVKDGVDLRGYLTWSLLDNFEWADGYTKRFGIHYVDYENGLRRYEKASAAYLRSYIASVTKDLNELIN